MESQLRKGEDGNDRLCPLLPNCQVVSGGVGGEGSDPSSPKAAETVLVHGGEVQELHHVPC